MPELHTKLSIRSMQLYILNMREFRTFRFRDASYRISVRFGASGKQQTSLTDAIYTELFSIITGLREGLEAFVKTDRIFLSSFSPVEASPEAPEAAKRMAEAASPAGVGPMAAVAGTIAQMAAESVFQKHSADGLREVIIENGGDIFIQTDEAPADSTDETYNIIISLFTGPDSPFKNLALKIPSTDLPVSVCSSSSIMGHSASMGNCDLATVISKSGSLADAAATAAANLVKTTDDLKAAAEQISSIEGIIGVLLFKDDKMAAAGQIPEIIRQNDPESSSKITIY